MYKLLDDLRGFENTHNCFAFGEYHHLTFKEENDDSGKEVLDYLQIKGNREIEMKQVAPTIEDCFIKLTIKIDECRKHP